MLVSMTFLIACLDSVKIFPEKTSSIKHAIQSGSAVNVPVKEDVQGIVTASVRMDSTMTQVVEASKSSAISGTALAIPPGSLTLDTEITIEEGVTIASTVVANELKLDQAIEPASPAVVVESTTMADAATPFRLAIPLSGSSGLLLSNIDRSKLIIVYKVIQYGNGGTIALGVIPTKELTVENGNLVSFETRYFGSYQVATSETVIEERIETKSETQILTKAKEKALDPISWSLNSPVSYADTRTAEFSFSVSGFEGNVSCAITVDQNKSSPWDFSTSIGGAESYAVPALNDSEHTLYAKFECHDQNGRIAASPWSDGVTIPAKPTISPATETNSDVSNANPPDTEQIIVEVGPGLLVPGNKDKERQYFQTRRAISLELNLDNILGAEGFSIENETTGAVLFQDQKSSRSVLLTYNPFDSSTRNIFTYGENNLKTLVSQSNSLVSSQTKIWIRDFNFFEMAYQSFGSKRQVTTALSGMRFEGWFNVMGHQKVTAGDGTTLVTGMQAMLDQ